jgi:hypothetical protein
MRSAGYRIAQAGAVLMILGGIVDLSVRELLPHHVAALGSMTGSVPGEAERLVLALLRALGSALVAAGFAVLILLHAGREGGKRLPFVAAAVVAVLAEGPNAWGILSTGSALFWAPLSFMLLVVGGALACAFQHRPSIPDRGASHVAVPGKASSAGA